MRSRLKVTHIITTISRGGAENQLLILVRRQILNGLEVTVIPLKGELELLEEFENIGAKVDLEFHNRNFARQWLLARLLNRGDSDIVHLHLPQAEILGINIRKKVKVITRHFGDQFFPKKNRVLSRYLSRKATNSCSRVIAISNAVANFLFSSREISDVSKVRIIPYGIDTEKFISAQIHKTVKTRSKNSSLSFGSLARLSYEKDLPTMFRGFALASQNINFNANLTIYGEGPDRQNLERLIVSLGMQEHIFMPGRTLDPIGALGSIDVFVLTSKFEGFGLVLLEAMALNKPIICSRIDAAIEVLGDSGAAILFPPGDEVELANCFYNFNNLLKDDWIGAQNLQLTNFSDDKMASEIQKLYYQAIESTKFGRKG